MIWGHLDQKDDSGVDNKPPFPSSWGGGMLLRTPGSLPGEAEMYSPRHGGNGWCICSEPSSLSQGRMAPDTPPLFCQARKHSWTPRPATGRHGHRVPETHHLYKPFIPCIGFIQTCKIQMQNSLGASVPISKKNAAEREASSRPSVRMAPPWGGAHWLERC